MFVDASAMVAILIEESDPAALTKRLPQAVEPCTSPIAIYEAVARRRTGLQCPDRDSRDDPRPLP